MAKSVVMKCAACGLTGKHRIFVQKGRERIHSLCRRCESARQGARTARNPFKAEYKSWIGLRERCNNPSSEHYAAYGGRGIKVCAEWASFEKFLSDMGLRPTPRHSIDRRDNEGDYSPENCRWATTAEQNLNKRTNKIIVYRGVSLTLTEWSRRTGLKLTTLRMRLKAGWSVEDALTMKLAF